MPPHVLRRCDCCKKYHAAYIIDDPEHGGKAYYCYTCWKAKYASAQPPVQEADRQTQPMQEQAPSEEEES